MKKTCAKRKDENTTKLSNYSFFLKEKGMGRRLSGKTAKKATYIKSTARKELLKEIGSVYLNLESRERKLRLAACGQRRKCRALGRS